MPAIEVNQIGYVKNHDTILDAVSFHLDFGDYIGLIGPNGAGKTTLIKIILNFISPTSGEIKKSANLNIGYVPQNYALSPIIPISVREVLSMSGNHHKNTMQSCLNKVDMDAYFLKKNFHHLSGGQQQRVIIARALCTDPQVLIFDEPLSSIDLATKIKLYDLLSDLNQQSQLTILFVSHEIDRIIDKCHRVLCLNKTLHEGCHPLDFSQGKMTCTKDLPHNNDLSHRTKSIHHHH